MSKKSKKEIQEVPQEGLIELSGENLQKWLETTAILQEVSDSIAYMLASGEGGSLSVLDLVSAGVNGAIIAKTYTEEQIAQLEQQLIEEEFNRQIEESKTPQGKKTKKEMMN